MDEIFAQLAGFVWNKPVILLCFSLSAFFTLFLGFIQIRCFPHAIALVSGKYDNPNEHGQITHFQALSAALSGTIGLGNIAGVAIAIALGGPGAILWMWILGFLGMATKYAECALGTRYRDEDPETGEVRGGPMYYITNGIGKKWKPMAVFYAFAISLAGIGSASLFQTNQAAMALSEFFQVPRLLTGALFFVLALLVIIGGIKRIGAIASKIVPLMCGLYLFGALSICLMNIDKVFLVCHVIVSDAFSGGAAAGGAIGTVIMWGVRRAIFSNEAGLGSASIAHAAVKTDYPIREGIVASLGPLIDTVIVCTATAMVIILSGYYGNERFLPIENGLQTFSRGTELSESVSMDSNWQIVTEGVPKNTDKLRNFTDHSSVLSVSPGTIARGHQVAAVSDIPVFYRDSELSDGVKFSYYMENGPLMVTLFDGFGEVIASLKLSEGELSGNHYVDVTDKVTAGKWSSVLLAFNDDLKSKMSENPERYSRLKMVFGADPVQSRWFIDNVAAVQSQSGVQLTIAAFDSFFHGFGSIFITISVVFFAFSTLITWSYYGETAAGFVFGPRVIMAYKLLFVVMILFGSVLTLNAVVNFSDAMLGLTVIPNAIALFILFPKVKDMTTDYFAKLKKGEIKPYR